MTPARTLVSVCLFAACLALLPDGLGVLVGVVAVLVLPWVVRA